jgi:hypothetical protein
MEINNTIIFNPELEREELLHESSKIEEKLTNLHNLQKHFSYVLVELENSIDNTKCFENLLGNSFEFNENIQFLFDNWPTKDSNLSKSKTKLFKVDLDKFYVVTKKQTKVKFDKLEILLKSWYEEYTQLNNEIVSYNEKAKQIDHQIDNLTAKNGLFEVNCESLSCPSLKLPSTNRWCVDINHIEDNKWYSWPSDIEQYTGQKFKPKDSGIGAGEHWLSFVFGGEVQGQNSTFDLAIFNKQLNTHEYWEVKEFDPKTQIIRLGSHGTNAAIDMSQEITDVVSQLKNFIDAYDALCLEQIPIEGDDIESWLSRYAFSLRNYLSINYNKLVIKGDISNIDLKELTTPIAGATNAFNKINERCNCTQSQINFCGRKIKLSIEQYAKFLLLVPEILTFEEKLIAIVSILKHPVLQGTQTYNEFLTSWVAKLLPSKAFSNVSGVFLVHKLGFIKIPTPCTDAVFDYYRMAQGRRPNFKIKNIEIPQELKQISFFGHSHFNDTMKLFVTPQQISGSFDLIGGCVTKTDEELFSFTPWETTQVNELWFNGNKIKILPITKQL